MTKLKSTFKNMFLSLLAICLVVAVLLAQVHKLTAEPIAEAKAKKLANAIKEVVPEFDNNPVEDAYKMSTDQGDSLLVYPALMSNEIVGFAINSNSNNGFSGDIEIMVGFDTNSKIINYAVLSHAETPGLGSKMGDWFKDLTKPSQSIIDRNMSEGELKVVNDGGNIDAITASTITSRAFLEAVNKAYSAYKKSDVSTSIIENDSNIEEEKEDSDE